MGTALSIGQFAQLTHLSVRTLRRYHEAGLLVPASVDPSSGYRYYLGEQIPSAQVIHRLRELDMPLAEVGRVLATQDSAARAELLAGHLQRLESELDRTRAAVTALRTLLSPDAAELRVELRAVAAMTVAAIGSTVDLDEVTAWYDDAMDELDAAVGRDSRPGSRGGRYDNELFTHGTGRVLVYRAVDDPPTSGRIDAMTLPAVELATTVHAGGDDDIAVTYGRLGAWVVDHALAVDGPVHETYLVGPRDGAPADTWRTEIGWPIFRVSPP